MNITINTQAKTVIIESACLKELSKVKKALEAIGENPDEYTISSGSYYWTYPAQPTWPPLDITYQTGYFDAGVTTVLTTN